MFGVDIYQVDVDAYSKWHLREIEMHVDMHRLSPLCFKRRIRALEAQVWVWSKHALRYGRRKRIGNYIVEDKGGIDDSVLLDVACAGAEVVVGIFSVVEGSGFANHARVEGVEICG